MLQDFLEQKPLYYNEIDYTRMPRAYEAVKDQITLPKIIHIIGTNGKGTTGRFLAQALHVAGKKVGHYTSPHILRFNERIWMCGTDVDDATLEEAHQKLQRILAQQFLQSLSYFEYTTLLAMIVFQTCEYVVLEAGLGGEYDATAVFENILTIATVIDKDHEAFLGSTIEEIANTKLNAVQKELIIAEQKHEKVYEIARQKAEEKNVKYWRASAMLNKQEIDQIKEVASSLPHYLQQNLITAIAAVKHLGYFYDVNKIIQAKLFGRMSKVADNIIVDVGHNLLAAQVICSALGGNKYILVYNSYKDKDYSGVLKTLRPIIKEVAIIEVDDKRIVVKEILQECIKSLGLSFKNFKGTEDNEQYLVFGSFSVVEAFLHG